MELTAEQQQAIDSGEAVEVTVDNRKLAIMQWDLYERVRNRVFDDGPLSEQERRYLLEQAGKRAGWDDPEMSVYDDLDPRR